MITIDDTEDLFHLLKVALPYEYDERLVSGTDYNDTIEISKEDTDTVLYIAEGEEPLTFTAALYSDAGDDDPLVEGIYWDSADGHTTPETIVNDIKELF